MDVMQMSAREIVLLNAFSQLAEEAFKAEQVIKECYGKKAFGLGETEILVFQTVVSGEYYGYGYLTVNGTFRYEDNWWGGRQYEFKVDAESIYKLFRSCYLRKNGSEDCECNIEHIDEYFREFIASIVDKDE